MADYAETEIAANELQTAVTGCRIVSVVESGWFLKRKVPLSQLVGFQIAGVSRIGKAFLFSLTKARAQKFLASRLGMSGRWRVYSEGYDWRSLNGWAITFILEHEQGRIALVYSDARRFGTIEIKNHIHDLDALRFYGPEVKSPLFTREWVEFCCSRQKVPIKALLLHQQYFAGLGNWLCSEILFNAHIDPTISANILSQEQIRRLFEAIHLTVHNAITQKGKGLPERDGINVYGREGKPCFVCATKIRKRQIKKRSVYWCPECQSNWKNPKPVAANFVADVVRAFQENPKN